MWSVYSESKLRRFSKGPNGWDTIGGKRLYSGLRYRDYGNGITDSIEDFKRIPVFAVIAGQMLNDGGDITCSETMFGEINSESNALEKI